MTLILVTHVKEMFTHQWFGEEVGNVVGSGHERHTDLSFLDAFADKEVTTMNVFSLRVMLRIVRKINGRHVILPQRRGLGCSTAGSLKMATKRSFVTVFVKCQLGERLLAARLHSGHMSPVGRTAATSARAAVMAARSGGRALKKESFPELRLSGVHPVRRGWCGQQGTRRTRASHCHGSRG